MINYEDFSKVELKVGTIIEAEEVEGSERLIKFKIDLGSPSIDSGQNLTHDIRQILAGIKTWYKPEDLIGKQVVVVANLEPRMMMGLESQGMLLAAGEEEAVLLQPLTPVSPGTKVR